MLDGQAGRFEEQLNLIAAEHARDAPWLTSLAIAVGDRRWATTESVRDELTERYCPTLAVLVLIEGSEDWCVFALGLVVFVQDVGRAYLTLRVNALRDAEERAQVTPKLSKYWQLYRVHR